MKKWFLLLSLFICCVFAYGAEQRHELIVGNQDLSIEYLRLDDDGSDHGRITVYDSSGTTQTLLWGNGDNYFLQPVGIGTTSPDKMLDIEKTAGTADMRLTGSGANVEHKIGTEYDIVYSRTAGTAIMDIEAHPSDGTSSAYYRFGLLSGSTGANHLQLFASNSTTVAHHIGSNGVVFNESGGVVTFRVEGSGASNAFVVQGSDGFIGLDTASPQDKLHVVGDIRYSGTMIHGSGSGNISSASDVIPNTYSDYVVTVSNGSVTLTSTPSIATAGAVAGQTILILNEDLSDDPLILQDKDTLSGSALMLGATTRTIGEGGSIMLRFNGTYWVELFYNNSIVSGF